MRLFTQHAVRGDFGYQPMVTNVRDPSCLKTKVEGKQGHALRIKQSTKNYLMEEFVKELAPSPRQLLNGQGVRKISGYRNLR